MISRRTFLGTVALGALAAPRAIRAQQANKVWRIGFLSPYSPEADTSWRAALELGLRELGYIQGQNIVIERKHAAGRSERLAEMAAELIGIKVDVVVAHGLAAHHANKASSTIPIVVVAEPDPVGTKLVASLSRPGGNVTGLSDFHSGLVAKRLELLKEVVPSASRVAVLYTAGPASLLQLQDIHATAPAFGVTVVPSKAGVPEDVGRLLTTIGKERPDALIVFGAAIFGIQMRRIADFTVKNRLPAIYTLRQFPDAGGLMSYGADFADLYRRAATYVDKILKGAKPADLPIEQPTKFELVINLKTAKALGLTIPPSVLLRAGQVIE